MTDIPRAIASGVAGAPPDHRATRRVAIAVGAIAAVFVFALYGIREREVPARALELVGGAGSGVARYGGIVGTDKSRRHIELPNITQADAADTIATLANGGLEFREVIQSKDAVPQLVQLGIVGDGSGDPRMEIDSWRADNDESQTQTDYYVASKSRAKLEAAFAEAERRGWKPPPNTEVLYEQADTSWRSYFVSKTVEVDGRSVEKAIGSYDPNTNTPVVLLDFNRAGTRAFGELTARIVGHKLATVLGGVVRSAPMINTPIRGGRAQIAMGAGDPAKMEHDRDVLVGVLQSGSLPLSGQIKDAHWVAPSNGVREPIAHVLIALVGGLLAAALAWLLVAGTKPEHADVAPIAGAPSVSMARRIAWTLLAIAIYIAGTEITLPGVNGIELDHILRGSDLTMVSVFGLGFVPLITSFVVVELVASIVPPWRRLRDTVLGRRKLGLAVAIAACLVSAVQAYFVVGYLTMLPDDVALVVSFWPAVATLAAGPLVLAILASLIGSRGLGSGYGILMVVGWLWAPSWSEIAGFRASSLVLIAAAIASTTIIVLAVLRWRVRAPGRVAIPLPAAGLLPLQAGGGVVALIGVLAALGWRSMPEPIWESERILGTGLVAVAAVVVASFVWAWVFVRPKRRARELAAASLSPTSAASWLRAVVLSSVAVLALYATGAAVPQWHGLGHLANPILVATAAAVIADLVDEWRARRRAQLVPVWPLHDPLLVDVARARLAAANIPHHIQSTRFRTLLWLAGAYVPMMVLVPAEHAEAAHAEMRDWLSCLSSP
ncbi:MAG TPA: hypothetical protein VGL61_12455 [Kofleriaceae bacterium]